jgi:hypothetical protein
MLVITTVVISVCAYADDDRKTATADSVIFSEEDIDTVYSIHEIYSVGERNAPGAREKCIRRMKERAAEDDVDAILFARFMDRSHFWVGILGVGVKFLDSLELSEYRETHPFKEHYKDAPIEHYLGDVNRAYTIKGLVYCYGPKKKALYRLETFAERKRCDAVIYESFRHGYYRRKPLGRWADVEFEMQMEGSGRAVGILVRYRDR